MPAHPKVTKGFLVSLTILAVTLVFIFIGVAWYQSVRISELSTQVESAEQLTRDAARGGLLASVQSCASEANFDQEFSDSKLAQLKLVNEDIVKPVKDGYALRFICAVDNQLLFFYDSYPAYQANAGRVSDASLSQIAEKVMLGISDTTGAGLEFHPATIAGYRFEGEGGVQCYFDQINTNHQLDFRCKDTGASGTLTTRYVYDLDKNEQVTVSATSTVQ